MPKKSARKSEKLRPDVAEVAHRVMLEAIGEAPRTPPPNERTEKNPEAARRGKKGGKEGGAARARSLSKARRTQIAKKAAKTRWKDPL